MEKESTLEGLAFLGDDLEPSPVSIQITNGIIGSIEEVRKAPDRWILPALFNAHTHIGDTVALDTPIQGDLESIVSPPDGLKHRILRDTNRETLISAMHSTIRLMESSGCAGFADFREGGQEGVTALREAALNCRSHPLIFGRDGGEISADGFGISSVRDIPDLDRQVEEAKKLGRLIAIHAGERDSSDIEGALAYEPDLLIHCTHARERDLRFCADREIPIVVCPRSNWMLGVTSTSSLPPVEKMIDLGCKVFIGTDNVMFIQPDLWREMAFLSVITPLPASTLLRMGVAGSILTGSPYWIQEGNPASIIEIDTLRSNLKYSRDLHRTLVSRIGSDLLDRILFN